MNARRRRAGRGPGGPPTDAAVRGAMLVLVAVVLGALLLWRAHDDPADTVTRPPDTTQAPDDDANGEGPGVTEPPDANGEEPGDTTPPPELRPPAEVRVLVANGSGVSGAAGSVTQRLIPKGYTTLQATNAASSGIPTTTVYYREGYLEDAVQVARELGVPEPIAERVAAMPEPPPVTEAALERAEGAHVLIVLGTDQLISLS